MNGLIAQINALLTTPLTEQIDTKSLFLLIGVIIISFIVWGMILHYVTMAARDVADI